MAQLNDDAVEQPVDDVVGQPVVTKSDMGFEVIDTPWWVVLWKGLLLSSQVYSCYTNL